MHNTVSRILEIIKDIQMTNAEPLGEAAVEAVNNQVRSYEQIKELISVDTLKTMQLLGFNYKAAIGEPLTLMLKNFILSKVAEPDSVMTLHKIVTPEMVEILKDKIAYENYRNWIKFIFLRNTSEFLFGFLEKKNKQKRDRDIDKKNKTWNRDRYSIL